MTPAAVSVAFVSHAPCPLHVVFASHPVTGSGTGVGSADSVPQMSSSHPATHEHLPSLAPHVPWPEQGAPATESVSRTHPVVHGGEEHGGMCVCVCVCTVLVIIFQIQVFLLPGALSLSVLCTLH